MKPPLDKFSVQSEAYKKFRPTYPAELYDFIYAHCGHKNIAWDCATGNGQVALTLAQSFKNVIATDINELQIQNAESKENISYLVERAENTSLESNSIDLITVGQALHWFDFGAFNVEANRVLKPTGIIALWGYGLLRINPIIDEIIGKFYSNEIGPYWNEERRHIDNEYESIPFDFEAIEAPISIQIKIKWTLEQLHGYLNTWSSVQNYIEKNGTNPVDKLIQEISRKWKPDLQEVRFPIFIRVGKPKI